MLIYHFLDEFVRDWYCKGNFYEHTVQRDIFLKYDFVGKSLFTAVLFPILCSLFLVISNCKIELDNLIWSQYTHTHTHTLPSPAHWQRSDFQKANLAINSTWYTYREKPPMDTIAEGVKCEIYLFKLISNTATFKVNNSCHSG